MGLFDFGGSVSESSAQASSFDNLDQIGFNFGESGSVSGGVSGSSSTQNIAFQDLFQQLFGGASNVAGGIDTSSLTNAANLLFTSGGGFLEQLAGGGAGAGFLEDRLQRSDELTQEQIDLLGEDIGRFLSEDVNPAITSGGVSASTLGGSRGEVQRGIASRGASEAFARGASDIRLGAQAQNDSIAQFLAGNETERLGSALTQMPGLFGLAEAGTFAGLSPFMLLSQIMGGPTTLTDSTSFSEQFGESFGLDFGFDQTTGRAGSQSSSSSSSASVNFGF